MEVPPIQLQLSVNDIRECVRDEGTGNRDIERPENAPVERFQRDGAGRPLGTGIVAAARSDESFGAESTATAFPISSAAVLRIPFYQRTLICNPIHA